MARVGIDKSCRLHEIENAGQWTKLGLERYTGLQPVKCMPSHRNMDPCVQCLSDTCYKCIEKKDECVDPARLRQEDWRCLHGHALGAGLMDQEHQGLQSLQGRQVKSAGEWR